MFIDIFNGDADGIFALHQYRLAHPVTEARLITGLKRDIGLLSRIEAESDCRITVFDVSLDVNRIPLVKLLRQNNEVVYFDHHFAGDIPASEQLSTSIDSSPELCTSLLVSNDTGARFASWAVCGAFGDNLHKPARQLAERLGLTAEQTEQLQELGELFNYNGYGESIEDLHFHPADLYRAIKDYAHPLAFIDASTELIQLRAGHYDDMTKAKALQPDGCISRNRVYFLPNASWARRISGVFSNLKAREKTGAAHAIIGKNKDNTLRISVRAPLDHRQNADTLCRKFPTGGGRAAAAGINSLPEDQLDEFLKEFQSIYA